jgi:uncharacterized protein YhbP (UPF0306 family)
MELINDSISQFIEKQKTCTLCCIDELGKPYCFSCFYVFNPVNGLLYFKSSSKSRHASLLQDHPWIAGSILPNKLNILVIKGIQFEGTILPVNHFLLDEATKFYHKKNPAGLAVPGDIWIVKIGNIKMTDNTLGFGKKICWSRSQKATTVSAVE